MLIFNQQAFTEYLEFSKHCAVRQRKVKMNKTLQKNEYYFTCEKKAKLPEFELVFMQFWGEKRTGINEQRRKCPVIQFMQLFKLPNWT